MEGKEKTKQNTNKGQKKCMKHMRKDERMKQKNESPQKIKEQINKE